MLNREGTTPCTRILILAATLAIFQLSALAIVGPSRAVDDGTGMALASPTPTPVPAPHRHPPLLSQNDAAGKPCVPLHDCPDAKPLRIFHIIPNNYPSLATFQRFAAEIPKSKWLTEFTAAYKIPGPTISEAIVVSDMPDLKHMPPLTVTDFQNYAFALSSKPEGKLLKPDRSRQTVYLFYVPCHNNGPNKGHGCNGFHTPMSIGSGTSWENGQGKLFTKGDALAFVLEFDPTLPGPFAVNKATVPASHETAESATDTPGTILFNIRTDDPDHPYVDTGANAGGTPWTRESGYMESADMSEGARWYEPAADGTVFEYERIYANERSKSGGDPAVPQSPHPYYNVSTDDWFRVTAGAPATIPVIAWSPDSKISWKVEATVSHWLNKDSTPAAAAPCQISSSQWTVHNGSAFDLRVDTPKSLKYGTWCEVRLVSTHEVANGDDRHEWWVGVIIQPPPLAPGDEACVCADGFPAGPAARAGTAACEHICRGHEKH